MTPQSNYEQARDEAAEKLEASLYDDYFDFFSFKAGSDFGRSYEQKLNADILADNKLMREALEFYADDGKWMIVRDFVGDNELQGLELFEVEYTKASRTLSQLKGKYE